FGLRCIQLAGRRDPVAANADVAPIPGQTAAVHDSAVGDEDVKHELVRGPFLVVRCLESGYCEERDSTSSASMDRTPMTESRKYVYDHPRPAVTVDVVVVTREAS